MSDGPMRMHEYPLSLPSEPMGPIPRVNIYRYSKAWLNPEFLHYFWKFRNRIIYTRFPGVASAHTLLQQTKQRIELLQKEKQNEGA